MEDFKVPGLDLSALLNPKKKEISEPSTPQGAGVFPLGPESTTIPVEGEDTEDLTEAGKGTKKPLNLANQDKPTIIVKDDEDIAGTGVTEDTKQEVSPIKAVSEFLKSKGLMDYDDKDFKDEDDFIADQYKKSLDKGLEDWKESLPEAVKNIITNYQEGVPIGALLEREREIFEYSQVDPTKLKDNEDLQKTLVNNYYAEIGWSAEDIEEKLTELKDTGVLEKEATRSLNKLLDISNRQKQELVEKAKNDKLTRENTYKEQVLKLQNTLKDTKEFVPGLVTNENEKKLVFDGITKFDKTGKNEVMKFMEKPENYMLISYLANVLKGDFSKIKATAKTAAVGDLKKTLSSTPDKQSAFSKVDTGTIRRSLGI